MSSLLKILRPAPSFAAALGLLFVWSCEFGTAPGFTPTVPSIAYATPVCDTVGRTAVHPVISTGGGVSLYTVIPALPAGLSFDSLTGLIAGTPVAARMPSDHTVIAVGPGGSDTTVIRLWAVAPYSPTLAPSIAVESPVIDTVGKAASHTVFSLGGPVTAYTLVPALPAGLVWNAATGQISGTPTAASAPVDYRIVATGPGGKDTATLHLAVVLRPSQQSSSVRPSIAYDSPFYDTIGEAVSHPVISLGGKVTSYAVVSIAGSPGSLPDGLALNTSTGLIAGVPEQPLIVYLNKRTVAGIAAPSGGYTSTGALYYIVATGPGGKDTAEVSLDIVWYEEYPVGPGPGQGGSTLNLTVNLLNSVYTNLLYKSSALTFKKMVVTLTSNVLKDAVIRDTVSVESSGMSLPFIQAFFSKSYAVKPLRHWTVNVKTVDARDSIVHEGTGLANNLLVGETRTVVVDAIVRFDTYAVKFSLPDSIGTATGTFKQRINFNHVRVTLDGAAVRDTVQIGGGYFTPQIFHMLEYDYVRPASHVWKVEVYGNMEDWPASLPLFTGSMTLPLPPCASCNSSSGVSMMWTGPGSSSDPNAGNPEIPIITPVPTVMIQRTSPEIVIISEPPLVIPKRTAP